ncbi:MAG: hypothetical protein F6J92_07715, partial [Symploca sp. SIO1A3]|nr:hypothetical protein [Symploca sp. SIO1A3]
SAKQLRFPGIPIGMGELLLLAWILLSALEIIAQQKVRITKREIFQSFFWFGYLSLLLLSIGWLFSLILNLSIDNAVYDFSALVFSGCVSIFIAINFNAKQIVKIYCIVSLLFLAFSTVSFVVAEYLPSILLPFEPWYVRRIRFTSWTSNPNQFALFLVVTPYAYLYLIDLSNNLLKQSFLCIALVISLGFGYLSRSDALYVSWALGFLFAFLYKLLYFLLKVRLNKKQYLSLYLLCLLFLSFLCLAFYWQQFVSLAQIIHPAQFRQSASRINLIWNGLEALKVSPLLGLGPGSHSGLEAALQGSEVHNSFLDWATNTGLLGISILLFLLKFVFQKSNNSKSIWVVTAFLALMCFIQFHYVFRQPFFWFNLIFLAQLSELKR